MLITADLRGNSLMRATTFMNVATNRRLTATHSSDVVYVTGPQVHG